MNRFRLLSSAIIFIACVFSLRKTSGQMFANAPIDPIHISPWIEQDMEKYTGVYIFGYSEGRSFVFVSFHQDSIVIQEHYFTSSKEGSGHLDDLEPVYNNYVGVLDRNQIDFNEVYFEFMMFNEEGVSTKTLKLDYPKLEGFKYELGRLSSSWSAIIDGKYPNTKFFVIPIEELRGMSPSNLKIMRNEIFARYGYKFKRGGQMEKYFSKQSWYSAFTNDVSGFITKIERENIQNILMVEKEKRKSSP